ncbi:MAG: acetyl/propionyl-CoA carboxylase alpha subunit [Roseivirga sp.]|jgi:acetyl/propionyl-CoA carboxylase alpha subunit
MSSEKFQINVNSQSFEVEADASKNSGILNGEAYALDLIGDAVKGFSLLRNNKSYEVQVLEADYDQKEFLIEIDGQSYQVDAADRFDLLLKDLGMEHLNNTAVNDLKAPMPGLVLAVKVSPGDNIQKGEALIVLEAMKMENVLKAEADCFIKSIDCIIGSAVEKGQVLISFEA